MKNIIKSFSNNLPHCWSKSLNNEFKKPYMKELSLFLQDEINNKEIYPKSSSILNSLKLSPIKNLKVVIIGQDPYHGENQANGLAFSVNKGTKIPPSLKNIYKELKNDLNIETPSHGDLTIWAKQGVLLLNTVLTVEASKAGSHQKKGWETFTDKIVKIINHNCNDIVFLLWGNHAQKKCKDINISKHKILTSVHPSPLSASRGFFNNNHFSSANTYLISKNKNPINWNIYKKPV